MAFGKHESYNEIFIKYKENIDMLLIDLKLLGFPELTKDELLKILITNMSIKRAVRMEIIRILEAFNIK